MNKIVRAAGRGLVVALLVTGLSSIPGAGADAATAPQEGEHDVVVNPNPVDTTAQVLDGNTQAVLDFGSRVIVGGNFSTFSAPIVFPMASATRCVRAGSL